MRQIPNTDDYVVFEFGTESIIIARGAEGEVRAHLNVCRHQGSRVCREESGNARVFSCPNHGWTYNLDGALRGHDPLRRAFPQKRSPLPVLPRIQWVATSINRRYPLYPDYDTGSAQGRPLALMEWGITDFLRWYRSAVQ